MKTFKQFLKESYELEKEGYTQDAWDKLDSATKSQYLKDHPDSKYNPKNKSTSSSSSQQTSSKPEVKKEQPKNNIVDKDLKDRRIQFWLDDIKELEKDIISANRLSKEHEDEIKNLKDPDDIKRFKDFAEFHKNQAIKKKKRIEELKKYISIIKNSNDKSMSDIYKILAQEK